MPLRCSDVAKDKTLTPTALQEFTAQRLGLRHRSLHTECYHSFTATSSPDPSPGQSLLAKVTSREQTELWQHPELFRTQSEHAGVTWT